MNEHQPNRHDDDSTPNGLRAGQRLRIVSGSLAGLQGTAVDLRHPSRVLMAIDLPRRGVFIEVGDSQLELINPRSNEARSPRPLQANPPSHVQALAEQKLGESSYPALKNISCEYTNLRLILQGRVPSYHMKQLAQTLVGTIKGVIVVNRLEVDEQVGNR